MPIKTQLQNLKTFLNVDPTSESERRLAAKANKSSQYERQAITCRLVRNLTRRNLSHHYTIDDLTTIADKILWYNLQTRMVRNSKSSSTQLSSRIRSLNGMPKWMKEGIVHTHIRIQMQVPNH